MSTLMNYTMQSFNFRGRKEARPFYDLIANIAAEEYRHIELVSYTINLLLTGADLGKLFPIPDVSNKQFPEARKLEEQGLHRIMFRWSPDDYRRVGEVWNGPHPEDGSELIVEDGIPEGFPPPDLEAEPQLTAPGVDAAFMQAAAERLFR